MSETFWSGLLPKSETQAMKFVTDNPTWDGRGIVVGILDTGVDPGAIGLSKTSDGKPKVIDIIDCSGSGDVAMGALVTPDSVSVDGKTKLSILGLSGRVLTLNPAWKNPSGKFRLGIKRAYEIYPRGLIDRVKEERKKHWMETHKTVEASLQRELLLSQSSSAVPASSEGSHVEDLKTRIAQLRLLEKDQEDPGPLYDCVIFHDGEMWQAVIDTPEKGDLSNIAPMTDYRVSQQYAAFSDLDALNYCVNIFDGGDTLSIVVDAGAHGSHVAGIVSACHSGQPELNGIAPGAQIISLKIGDSRLGSMETGVGLIRALIEAVKRGCHIINMSYGEAASMDDYGEFIKQAEVMVRKHGIVFVSSAGNNGPALSTVGCPGGTSSCCIGVAAMVTQSLMTAAYSMQSTVPETNFTWSSVGPTLDGDLGVSIIAPGGAVTSVPNWTRARNQLMNGTSMSSPNATGCVTLLLSAAMANKIKIAPVNMKRIVENSAMLLQGVDRLGQGHGLIQVQSAWDLIVKGKDAKWKDVGFSVKVESQRFSRGIYLRQPLESNTADTYRVTITTDFHDDVSPMAQTEFESRTLLSSTVPWVKCAERVLLVQGSKTLAIFIDPRGLPPGVHVAFVRGCDEAHPELGPQFQIPITVIRPEIIADQCSSYKVEMESKNDSIVPGSKPDKNQLTFTPGERLRRFIVPPKGCTFIDAVVTDCRTDQGSVSLTPSVIPSNVDTSDADVDVDVDGDVDDSGAGTSGALDGTARLMCVHAVQLQRGTAYNVHHKQGYVSLQPGSQHIMSWTVLEGVTMELTIARVWSTLESPFMSVTLYFRGVSPSPPRLLITGGERVSDIVTVGNTLASSVVEIMPTAKLDKWTAVVKPVSVGKVIPLGERDILSDGTALYQLVLEYEIDQAEAGSITPVWPALQGSLYESQFLSQLFMVYDGKKKLMGTGDYGAKTIKTLKGKHTIRIQVKHASVAVLESINDMPMQLKRALKTPVNLSFFLTQSDALVGTNKLGARFIAPGGSVSFFFREPTVDQIPKGVLPGDTLSGKVTYLRKDKAILGCGTKPGGYDVKYVIGDTKPAAASTTTATTNTTATASASSPVTVIADGDAETTPPVVPASTPDITAIPTTDVTSTPVTPIATSEKNDLKGKEKEKEKESGIDVAVREAKTKYLKSQIGNPTTFDSLYLTVEAVYPKDLALKLVALSHTVKCKQTALEAVKKSSTVDTLATAHSSVAAVLLSAQHVTSLVDQDKVARELGVNTDKDDVAAVASRKEADTMKAALIDSYSATSSAILDRVKLLSLEIEGKGGVPTATVEVVGGTSASVSASASASGPTTGEVSSLTSTVSAVSAETDTATSPLVSSSSSAPSPSLSSSSSHPESVAEANATPAAVSDLIEKRTQALAKDFDAACKQLQRWDDLNSDKHWLLCINRLKVKNQWGSALKKINDLASSSADNKSKAEVVSREVLNEERLIILEVLKWTHAVKDAKAWAVISSKDAFDLF